MELPSLSTRFLRYMSCGPWAGVAACFIMACLHLLWLLCEYIWAADSIEEAPDLVMYYCGAKRTCSVFSHSHSHRQTHSVEQKNLST